MREQRRRVPLGLDRPRCRRKAGQRSPGTYAAADWSAAPRSAQCCPAGWSVDRADQRRTPRWQSQREAFAGRRSKRRWCPRFRTGGQCVRQWWQWRSAGQSGRPAPAVPPGHRAVRHGWKSAENSVPRLLGRSRRQCRLWRWRLRYPQPCGLPPRSAPGWPVRLRQSARQRWGIVQGRQ